MKEAFKKLFQDGFLQQIFPMFLTGEWKKENLYGEFLSLLASGQLIEVTGVIMAILSFTCRFNKNMGTKKVPVTLSIIYQGSFIKEKCVWWKALYFSWT